jgi:hypothetical protein
LIGFSFFPSFFLCVDHRHRHPFPSLTFSRLQLSPHGCLPGYLGSATLRQAATQAISHRAPNRVGCLIYSSTN